MNTYFLAYYNISITIINGNKFKRKLIYLRQNLIHPIRIYFILYCNYIYFLYFLFFRKKDD